MRIGLYGGSFDPVHRAHLLVAQAAHEEVGLDRVYFVPAAQSPFKPERKLSPDTVRLQMLRRALAGVTYAEVDPQEIERGGVSYSIDTVRDYAARFPGAELYYLVGADHVAQLPKWRDAQELASRVTFLVVPRPGEHPAEFPTPFRGRCLQGIPLAVSASLIRERIRQRRPVDLLAPAAVVEAIHDNGLYLS